VNSAASEVALSVYSCLAACSVLSLYSSELLSLDEDELLILIEIK
jgi:hypothetical protein